MCSSPTSDCRIDHSFQSLCVTTLFTPNTKKNMKKSTFIFLRAQVAKSSMMVSRSQSTEHSLFAATASCGGVHGASEASEGKFLEALHPPPIAGLITHLNHCLPLHCLPPTRKKYENKSTFIFSLLKLVTLPESRRLLVASRRDAHRTQCLGTEYKYKIKTVLPTRILDVYSDYTLPTRIADVYSDYTLPTRILDVHNYCLP
jgi:hypothetical protein